jgi:chromosome segregation ATPase
MGKNRRLLCAATLLTFCAPLIDSNVWLFAWQNRQTAPAQSRAKTERSAELESEIRKLTKELHELHANQRRMLDIMLMQTEQARAERLEERLFNITANLRNVLAREAQLDYRLGHLDNELAVRNILNRVEGEKAVRNELEGDLRQVRAERERLEAEQHRLDQQLGEINARLEVIRGRVNLEAAQASDEADEKAVPPGTAGDEEVPPGLPAELGTDRPVPAPRSNSLAPR